MKISDKKIYILIAIAGFLILVTIFVFLREIKKSSEELTSQKSEINLLQLKEKNLENIKAGYKNYEENLEKINSFFVEKDSLFEFTELLRNFASDPKVTIKISLAKEKAGSEPARSFNISLSGPSFNIFKFIDKVENIQYLVEINNLNMRKTSQEFSDTITANLELTVLSK